MLHCSKENLYTNTSGLSQTLTSTLTCYDDTVLVSPDRCCGVTRPASLRPVHWWARPLLCDCHLTPDDADQSVPASLQVPSKETSHRYFLNRHVSLIFSYILRQQTLCWVRGFCSTGRIFRRMVCWETRAGKQALKITYQLWQLIAPGNSSAMRRHLLLYLTLSCWPLTNKEEISEPRSQSSFIVLHTLLLINQYLSPSSFLPAHMH